MSSTFFYRPVGFTSGALSFGAVAGDTRRLAGRPPRVVERFPRLLSGPEVFSFGQSRLVPESGKSNEHANTGSPAAGGRGKFRSSGDGADS